MIIKIRIIVATLFVASSFLVFAGGTPVVINEIDYDQVGVDTAEFIELYNQSNAPVNLNGVMVEIINGTGGGATILSTITLPNVMLAGNGYYVICADAITPSVPNCDFDGGANGFIQNGAPDAVGLRNSGGTLIDAVSYEGNSGAPYTETNGAPADSGAGSISRLPNGIDTNDNSADFQFIAITPGAVNIPPTLTINDVTQVEGDTGTITFNFTVSLSATANVTVQVDTADNTATIADSDYVAIVGQTVTFSSGGALTQTVSVTVNGDTNIEMDETFFVNLSVPSGASIADAQGVGTIVNNDVPAIIPTLNQYMILLLMLLMGIVVARKIKT
jgi:hypothetical protein